MKWPSHGLWLRQKKIEKIYETSETVMVPHGGRIKDISNQVFSSLTVVSFAGIATCKQALWECLCTCGNRKTVLGNLLRSGIIKNCGCSRPNNIQDIVGRIFGKLTVISRASQHSPIKWKCLCSCGNEKIVKGELLKSGNTQSCGCLRRGTRPRYLNINPKADTTREWCIYTLHDPREDQHIRYVGWTLNPANRLYVHKYRAKKYGHTYCERWIRKLLEAGVSPVMSEVHRGYGPWGEAEQGWIKHYRDLGHKLTNITEGGEGYVGYVPTPEAIAKIKEATTGREVPQEQREHMRQLMKGRVFSQEWKDKIRATKLSRKGTRGNTLTDEHKQKIGTGVHKHFSELKKEEMNNLTGQTAVAYDKKEQASVQELADKAKSLRKGP